MTTVTLNDGTPSEQVLSKAAQTFETKDSEGRTLVIKKPGILAQFNIVEVAGDAAKNDVWMNMVLPVIYLSELAGEAVIPPKNRLQLNGLLQRLDEHGLNALGKAVQEHFGNSDPEKGKAAIKK